MIKMSTIQKDLQSHLNKKLITGKVLLQNCKFVDENSRKTPAYHDPLYSPFYFHLGKYIKPKTVFSWNFSLGFLEKCFFMSNKETEYFMAFRNKDDVYFSPRMGSYNVKKCYKNDFYFLNDSIYSDELHSKLTSKKWECFFITDQNSYDDLLYMLELSWENINENGIIVVEYVKDLKKMKNAFYAFAKNYDTEPIVYNTRYGTGILQK